MPTRLVPAILLQRAREMRHESAPAEKKLWQCLRDRQLGGYKFRRQQPTPPFIADFCCLQLSLIVELDGDSHGDREVYDVNRTQRLEMNGYHVIRFLNDDVIWHLDCALEEILAECERLDVRKSPSPSPSPSPGVPVEGTRNNP